MHQKSVMNNQNDLEPKYQVSVQVLQGSTWQLRHLLSSAVCDETIYKKSKLNYIVGTTCGNRSNPPTTPVQH